MASDSGVEIVCAWLCVKYVYLSLMAFAMSSCNGSQGFWLKESSERILGLEKKKKKEECILLTVSYLCRGVFQ